MSKIVCSEFECRHCGIGNICKLEKIELVSIFVETEKGNKPFIKCKNADVSDYYKSLMNIAIGEYENGKMDTH